MNQRRDATYEKNLCKKFAFHKKSYLKKKLSFYYEEEDLEGK